MNQREEKAIELWRTILRYDPVNEKALTNLGVALRIQKRRQTGPALPALTDEVPSHDL